jgi:hypothetical protein
MFQTTTQTPANTAEMPVVQPVPSDKMAAAVTAPSTTRLRPKRCAVSFPVTEMATPARPAHVKSIVGSGIQSDTPSRAKVATRNVTAQARRAASSKVCTATDDPRHGAAVPEYRPEVEKRASG